MVKSIQRLFVWLSHWRRFCVLLVFLFLVRGVFVLSVLPPFEGWDEYQHLAYIVYLAENDRSPVLHQDSYVPESLYPAIVRYPHCKLGVEQVGPIGGLSYEEYWAAKDPPTVSPDAGKITLYQSQHSSLYYRAMLPFHTLLPGEGNTLRLLTLLREVHVLFGAAALWVALWAVGRLTVQGPFRYLLGLLIALQPLYLINCTRVANDAMALLFGTMMVVGLLVYGHRKSAAVSVLCGVLLGLAILAKTLSLTLIPFAVIVFASLAWQKKIRPLRAAAYCLLLLLAAGAVTFPYFRFNVQHFGMLTPMQEAVANSEDGRTMGEFVEAVLHVDWWRELSRRYLRHSLWRGGWSWLGAERVFTKVHEFSIWLSLLGALFILRPSKRRERWLFKEGGTFTRISGLCLGVAAGLGYHMIQTQLAIGAVATNVWYAMVSFPWLLCLFYQGLAGFPNKWLTRIGALMIAFSYLGAEIHGTLFVMVKAFTGHNWGEDIARERLAALHLPGLGPEATLPALAMMALLTLGAFGVWVVQCRTVDGK